MVLSYDFYSYFEAKRINLLHIVILRVVNLQAIIQKQTLYSEKHKINFVPAKFHLQQSALLKTNALNIKQVFVR
jgi:hypothetical protein